MPTNAELSKQVEELRAMLTAALGRSAPSPITIIAPKDRLDFIEFGSDRHAEFLGLTKDADSPGGWSLTDRTMWGPTARPEFLKDILRQSVAELESGPPPKPQSVDRRLPNYAPKMWLPSV